MDIHKVITIFFTFYWLYLLVNVFLKNMWNKKGLAPVGAVFCTKELLTSDIIKQVEKKKVKQQCKLDKLTVKETNEVEKFIEVINIEVSTTGKQKKFLLKKYIFLYSIHSPYYFYK